MQSDLNNYDVTSLLNLKTNHSILQKNPFANQFFFHYISAHELKSNI